MKRLAIAGLASLWLLTTAGSCVTDGGSPAIQTLEVDKSVAVSCVPKDSPDAPVYPDTKESLKEAADVGVWTGLMAGGWGLRDARLTYLEKLRMDCIEAAPK